MGEDQGKLLFMMGSDSQSLQKGNDAMDLVLDKYPDHKLAVFARLVKGFNLGREFKSISTGKKISVRKPAVKECTHMLSAVADASVGDAGVDNITLNQAMTYMAAVQKEAGEIELAKATCKRILDMFKQKKLNPRVMKTIQSQLSELDI